MKKKITGILAFIVLVLFTSCGKKAQQNTEKENEDVSKTVTFSYPENSPVGRHGALQVLGLQLCDADGNPVQLAGMSTAGWQWCANCYTKESIENLVKNWHINVLRLSMYVEEGGYNTNPQLNREIMCQLIEWCGEFGIYCIVDWHVLTPGDPLAPEYAEAENFFRYISGKYAGAKHIIYEICNEPNNCQAKDDPDETDLCTTEYPVTWEIIAEYANKIIPIIHQAAEEVKAQCPVIIVGTPQWNLLVDACLKEGRFEGGEKDLPNRDARLQYDNIMYAFHFYAAEHNEGLEEGDYDMYSYIYDVLGKLPVFCSEFGLTEASGDGRVDFDRTDKWLSILNGNNAGNQKVSFCNWSYCDEEEESAALLPESCAKKEWNNVSPSGEYIKKVIAVMK